MNGSRQTVILSIQATPAAVSHSAPVTQPEEKINTDHQPNASLHPSAQPGRSSPGSFLIFKTVSEKYLAALI